MAVFPLELQSDINFIFSIVFISQKVFSVGNHIHSFEFRALYYRWPTLRFICNISSLFAYKSQQALTKGKEFQVNWKVFSTFGPDAEVFSVEHHSFTSE